MAGKDASKAEEEFKAAEMEYDSARTALAAALANFKALEREEGR